ncbi:capsular biosynthesis protein [Novosphingobium sp. AAP83]|nr:capsular biosynthesis protein [Novosphingobium sp. AAP83]
MISLALLALSLLLDACVRPRAGRGGLLPGRNSAGMWLHSLVIAIVFGFILAVCGHVPASAALALALMALFMMVSNAKRAMLGEPLVFSDLALVGAIFKHPQFYLSALTRSQKALLVMAAPVVPALVWWLFVPSWQAHLAGLGLALAGALLIRLSLKLPAIERLAREPDLEGDVARYGLLATLILYRRRWRETRDPVPVMAAQTLPHPQELAIAIQCESFADPVEIFGDPALSLPGLAAAREQAWQWGDLLVDGFGAYTMRTEYGVLFGRSEAELGFRRFDPYLTARGEGSYALPARLLAAGWRSLFVHPHDLRFYNRDEIMHAGGFAGLVGEERFAPPAPDEGRYVTDKAMAIEILDLAAKAAVPTLVFAVTIENHGPWEPHASAGSLTDGYMRLVRNSDAMLLTLRDGLAALGRPATLVFYGDHRPSIPGVSVPGAARHTPYVILRFDAGGQIVPGEGQRVDLTPAQLHHAVLGLISGQAG